MSTPAPCARNPVFQKNRASEISTPLHWLAIGILAVTFPRALCAQDTMPAEPLRFDEQTLDLKEPELQTGQSPSAQPDDELPAVAERIVSGMRDAENRLANAQLDSETDALQERINVDLAKLLDALERRATQPTPLPGGEAPQQSAGQGASSTGGTGESGQTQPDASRAGESTEGDRPGTLTEAELEHRRNLATSVWGHLPQRERDEMLGAFSERFLPAYDELVRQYYESLAKRKTRQP